jgi:ABC-type nitrate/sulfonate/bicarbonate transport system ATPase subunit
LLQKELLRIWQGHRKTVFFVTHSVDEAIYLADRIVIMTARPGSVGEILSVDMVRPRRRSDAAFGKLAEDILQRLELEVMGLRN